MESLDLHSDYRMQKNPKENCKEDEGEMLIRVTKEKKEMNTYATSIGSGRYSPNSFALIQFSGSGVSNSLRPHGLQLTRLRCPSPTPGVAQTHVHWVGDAIQPYHPLSWCHPTISFFLHWLDILIIYIWVTFIYQL